MCSRLLAASSAAIVLTLTTFAGAQSASAPSATAILAPTARASAASSASDVSEGKLAYYGRKFAGRRTASGERYDPAALTMAHKTQPFGTMVRVTSLKTNRSVVVRVNDRGPNTPDRIADVSQAAAYRLRMLHSGIIDAKLEVVGGPRS